LPGNPRFSIRTIPNANAFSAFATCTPKGDAVFAAEGEPEICRDPAGSARRDIQRSIVDDIEQFASAAMRGN